VLKIQEKSREGVTKKLKYATYVEYRDKKKVNDHKIYLNTGVNTSTLSAWKNGEYVPKMDKQALIADYLKIPKYKAVGAGCRGRNRGKEK